MSTNNKFDGPVFILGIGRSGTKLLRSILSANNLICIPDLETNFLPMWLLKGDDYGDLSARDNFNQFYNNAITEPFFIYMKEREGINGIISSDNWYSSCLEFDIPHIFEALIKYYCNSGEGVIWGDKSPVNTRYIALISSAFKDAKFIHIVRDVRDCCASAKKAWKSNPYRAAQRWSDSLLAIKQASQEISNNYHEIRYEDLLKEPEYKIKEICDFLGIDFDSSMLVLNSNLEQFGDAAGSTKIISSNTNKFRMKFSANEVTGIEKIACDAMDQYGYPHDYTGPSVRLSSSSLKIYRLLDGFHHLVRNFRERGIKSGVIFVWKFFRMNTFIKN